MKNRYKCFQFINRTTAFASIYPKGAESTDGSAVVLRDQRNVSSKLGISCCIDSVSPPTSGPYVNVQFMVDYIVKILILCTEKNVIIYC